MCNRNWVVSLNDWPACALSFIPCRSLSHIIILNGVLLLRLNHIHNTITFSSSFVIVHIYQVVIGIVLRWSDGEENAEGRRIHRDGICERVGNFTL